MATFPSRVVIHQNQTQEQNDKEQEKWQHFSLFCHITINWKWICNSLLNSFIPDGIKKEKKPGRHNTQQQLDIKYEDKNWTCRNGRTRRNWSEPAACCYILYTTTTTTKNKKEPVRVDAPVYTYTARKYSNSTGQEIIIHVSLMGGSYIISSPTLGHPPLFSYMATHCQQLVRARAPHLLFSRNS